MNKQRITKFLKEADIFSKPVELLIKKEEGHKTLLGAFLSIGIYVVLGMLLYDSIQTLQQHSNPITFFNEIQYEKPELIHLTGKNFTVQFDLEDASFRNYLNTSIYQVTANMVHKYSVKDASGKTTVNFEREPLPVTVCSVENYLQKEIAEYFIALNPSVQYCVDWSKIDYIPLIGTFANDDYRYIQFYISLCDDETCPDKEFVKNFTKTNYFSMQISDTKVDLKNDINPHSPVGKDRFTTVSSLMFKEIEVYYQYVITETDFGLISSDIVQKKDIAFSRMEERVLLSESKELMSILFRLDTNAQYNFRQYAKFQDIFGQLGGIWQIFYSVALFLITPIRNLSYKISIINSLFNFEQVNTKQDVKGSKMAQVIHNKIINTRKSISSNKNNNRPNQSQFSRTKTQILKKKQSLIMKLRSMKEISKRIKEFFSSNKKKLKINKCEYLLFCCNCQGNFLKDKERTKIIMDQINFSSDRIYKSLDVLYIIKKLNEIDKLKMLLLNKDQVNLFDYLPKPTISANPFAIEMQSDHHKYFSILKKEKSNYQTTLDAQVSYKKVKQNLKDPINSKLVEYMGPQVQELFDFEAPLDSEGKEIDISENDQSAKINDPNVSAILESQQDGLNSNDQIMEQDLEHEQESDEYSKDVDELNPERIIPHSVQIQMPQQINSPSYSSRQQLNSPNTHSTKLQPNF